MWDLEEIHVVSASLNLKSLMILFGEIFRFECYIPAEYPPVSQARTRYDSSIMAVHPLIPGNMRPRVMGGFSLLLQSYP